VCCLVLCGHLLAWHKQPSASLLFSTPGRCPGGPVSSRHAACCSTNDAAKAFLHTSVGSRFSTVSLDKARWRSRWTYVLDFVGRAIRGGPRMMMKYRSYVWQRHQLGNTRVTEPKVFETCQVSAASLPGTLGRCLGQDCKLLPRSRPESFLMIPNFGFRRRPALHIGWLPPSHGRLAGPTGPIPQATLMPVHTQT
jgi:hypothetical protein